MKRPNPAACYVIGPHLTCQMGTLFGRRGLLRLASASAVASVARRARADEAEIRIGYIRWMERHPTISLLDQQSPDDGLAGALLATEDNNTTGQFLSQRFTLIDHKLHESDDLGQVLGAVAEQGAQLLMTDAPADQVLKLADAATGHGDTIFNIAATDDELREENCRNNVIHVAPTRTMLADGLGQYLVWKKWSRWLLAYGSHPDDAKLADAYRRSAKRFGARIVEEREFKDTGGARQTDSGVTETQGQIPVFTQGAREYDVLVAADENQVFAGYLPYRTWDPRPVCGSAGLMPVTWDPSSESWGGTQLQNRFVRRFHRLMKPLDMQAWTACRMIGEAASHAKSADSKAIMTYMQGPDFGVAAYKGKRLTLRNWNWQLRQPIMLSDGRNVVSKVRPTKFATKPASRWLLSQQTLQRRQGARRCSAHVRALTS